MEKVLGSMEVHNATIPPHALDVAASWRASHGQGLILRYQDPKRRTEVKAAVQATTLRF